MNKDKECGVTEYSYSLETFIAKCPPTHQLLMEAYEKLKNESIQLALELQQMGAEGFEMREFLEKVATHEDFKDDEQLKKLLKFRVGFFILTRIDELSEKLERANQTVAQHNEMFSSMAVKLGVNKL